jgi:hypothetical protein
MISTIREVLTRGLLCGGALIVKGTVSSYFYRIKAATATTEMP